MAYSELIKDINTIRAYIRSFYVYGFYTRDEYAALSGMSVRSYDNEKRRVESWMGEYLNFHQNAEGRKVFLSAAGDSILHNPLYRAFKAKSFTTNDILLHFFLMDLFTVKGELDQNMVADCLIREYPGVFNDRLLPDEKTIRLKLKELEQLGLLHSEKKGRNIRYRIEAQHVDPDIPGLWDAVNFFSEAAPLGVVGSFLLDKKAGQENEDHCFRFRHHYLMHAVDSEILCELLLAIDEGRSIWMRVDNVFQGSRQYETTPLKIYVSTQSGREYLLSWNHNMERFFFTRLDRIIWVAPLKPDPEIKALEKLFASQKDSLWGVSFGGLEEVGKARRIRMLIRAGEHESYIPARMEREKHCGTVTKTGENEYLFTAEVFDPMEIFPWICSFTGRILRLECDDPAVTEKYAAYLSQMAETYGLDEELKGGQKAEPDHGVSGSTVDAVSSAAAFPRLSEFPAIEKAGTIRGRHDFVFHEVYGAYYNAVARVLAMAVRKKLTPRMLMRAVQSEGFAESCMYLPDRLLSGEWPMLTDALGTELKKQPAMPLTRIQKRWLRSLAEDPRIRLFLDDEALARMKEQLGDIRPLYTQDTFCYYDRFSDGDPFDDPEYIEHFRTVLDAIRMEEGLSMAYENRYGTADTFEVIPLYIEYSSREDKFRLYAAHMGGSEWKEPYRLNLGRIRECRLIRDGERERQSGGGEGAQEQIRRDSVTIELEDSENTLERMMFHFSFLEKKTERLGDREFRTVLYYPKADETEVLIRILSFGQQVKVVSDGYIKEETRRRLLSQIRLFN